MDQLVKEGQVILVCVKISLISWTIVILFLFRQRIVDMKAGMLTITHFRSSQVTQNKLENNHPHCLIFHFVVKLQEDSYHQGRWSHREVFQIHTVMAPFISLQPFLLLR